VPQESPFMPPELPLRLKETPPILPTPLYDKLKTNVAQDLIQLSAKRFPENSTIFPSRQDVEQYLVSYADDFRHLIKFSPQVDDILLRQENGKDQWDMRVSSTITGEPTTSTFDGYDYYSHLFMRPELPFQGI
jgi:hypothetical protein